MMNFYLEGEYFTLRVIKYGTPRQIMYFTCHTCGCEFEIYDEEIAKNIDGWKVRFRCPCCGIYLYDLRDKIEVRDGCLSHKCKRISCAGCEWGQE